LHLAQRDGDTCVGLLARPPRHDVKAAEGVKPVVVIGEGLGGARRELQDEAFVLGRVPEGDVAVPPGRVTGFTQFALVAFARYGAASVVVGRAADELA
jgi:hypothetical protein